MQCCDGISCDGVVSATRTPRVDELPAAAWLTVPPNSTTAEQQSQPLLSDVHSECKQNTLKLSIAV
jgi:hypothetical protein